MQVIAGESAGLVGGVQQLSLSSCASASSSSSSSSASSSVAAATAAPASAAAPKLASEVLAVGAAKKPTSENKMDVDDMD